MDTHDPRFQNRTDAGKQLAIRLSRYARDPSVLILGLPRGGVPVAYEVAQALGAPLDICLVRKLGVPSQPELAMGAIAVGQRELSPDIIRQFGIDAATLEAVTSRELQELQRRDRTYRGHRPPPPIRDRTVILIDDGIATGSTIRAAIAVIKPQHPARLIVAVPVAPLSTCQELRSQVDEVVCLMMPTIFHAIGLWYQDFTQTDDETVCRLLASAIHPFQNS